MSALPRRLRRILQGGAARSPFSAERQRDAYVQAQWLVRAFYMVTLVVAFQIASELFAIVNEESRAALLWPVFWVQWVGQITAARVLIVILFAAAIACLLVPASHTARIVLTLALLEVVALRFSFGYFYHHMHIWIWLAAIFAAFPVDPAWRRTSGERPARRHLALTVFFIAQVIVAMFYSLSGLWKVLRGVIVPVGYMSSFAPDAMASMVLDRWLINAYPTVLQDVFVANMWIGQPAHLFVMYVETFMLVAVFRPAMHRPFGVALIVFHFMVWLVMGIAFWYQPIQLALLFVLSPFAASSGSWRTDARQLPLFGDLLALLTPRRVHAPPAPGVPECQPTTPSCLR